MTKKGEIEYEALRKLTDGFNDIDLRNVSIEAGIYTIRA
jgi:26S proteasome regulatory subunit T4